MVPHLIVKRFVLRRSVSQACVAKMELVPVHSLCHPKSRFGGVKRGGRRIPRWKAMAEQVVDVDVLAPFCGGYSYLDLLLQHLFVVLFVQDAVDPFGDLGKVVSCQILRSNPAVFDPLPSQLAHYGLARFRVFKRSRQQPDGLLGWAQSA